MEIILTILFLAALFLLPKISENKATNHCKSYHIDYGKVTDDRLMNHLSNAQINKNIIDGKYDIGRMETAGEIKAQQDAFWEDYKKKHPWMDLN